MERKGILVNKEIAVAKNKNNYYKFTMNEDGDERKYTAFKGTPIYTVVETAVGGVELGYRLEKKGDFWNIVEFIPTSGIINQSAPAPTQSYKQQDTATAERIALSVGIKEANVYLIAQNKPYTVTELTETAIQLAETIKTGESPHTVNTFTDENAAELVE